MGDVYAELCAQLPLQAETELLALCGEKRRAATEIRFDAGRPASVFSGTSELLRGTRTLTAKDVSDVFFALCGYSPCSHRASLESGYITLRGGHRAGICGTRCGGELGIMDISGINIRIARQYFGAADELIGLMGGDFTKSVLIFGAPASGKTTVLRDYARRAASGTSPLRTSVIDERGELAAVYRGEPQFDLGSTADVFDRYGRSEGFETAIRAFAPRLIVCDEIYTPQDASAVERAKFSGVAVAATIHSPSSRALFAGGFGRQAEQLGLFDCYVGLGMLAGRPAVTEFVKAGAL